jgi:2-haloacid dehalogenase
LLDLPPISALTFDCYGTLVDWETGILTAVKDVLSRHGVELPSDDQLLQLYAELELEAESGRYKPYREVLASVMDGVARRCGIPRLSDAERNALAESLPRWPVFPDTAPFLRRAARTYKLAICSNIDGDLFEGTRKSLGTRLDHAITAQSCGSYKPNPRHFHVALALLGLPPGRVLHVAESRRHDIEPAKALGFQTVWVNRHRGRAGQSASGSGDAVADLEVGNLDELADVLKLAPVESRRS